MEKTSVFQFVHKAFVQKNISCVLIGGFAVNCYGVARQTADVDFLVATKDIEVISSFLINNGFKLVEQREIFARFRNETLFLMDLDFLMVDGDTLCQITKEGKEIEITGEKFIIPSLDHLIALKIHALKNNYKIRQYRDLPDIIRLIQVNHLNPKDDKFRALCLKYGTQDIYEKILGGSEGG